MAKIHNVKRNRIDSITLELNGDELVYLCTVLARTGGDSLRSLRRHADSITAALAEQGIKTVEISRQEEIDHRYGGSSIYFKDEKE